MEYSGEQGDINATDSRGKYWERNLSPAAKAVFEEDYRYFLHQNLSTPVLARRASPKSSMEAITSSL